MSLKAYYREWDTYRWEWRIKLSPRFSALVAEEVAKYFNLRVRVDLTNTSRGTCDGWNICLPYKGCKLGMILHEVAHAYNRQRYRGDGHTGTFVNAQGIVFSQSRVRIKDILLKVKAQIDQEKLEQHKIAQRLAAKEIATAERKQKSREIKSSRGYRIAKTEEKIRRLESKLKRLQTRIRTARRSLSHLKRWEQRATKENPSKAV